MTDANELHELVEGHLRGELSESQAERLAELLDSDAAARKEFIVQAEWDTRLADVLREAPQAADTLGGPGPGADGGAPGPARTVKVTLNRVLWAAAAAIIVALTAGLYFQQPTAEKPIAKVTGLSGSLQWTGDGGRVFHDLSVGAELSGGTIEGLAPGSWFELEFNDGSTVTISGSATLTFSDHGQKKLHLKDGSISGNVRPQPADKPMLIYTRSATLEVIGTQFDVDAGLLATTLNVSEGTVRIKRLSDGSTVDVPASHRVVAAADRELLAAPVPDSVNRWISQLQLGPTAAHGKWSPKTDTQQARLATIPYTSPEGKTIYTAGFGPSHGDRPSVIVQVGSRLRVRGRIESACKVYFGVTVRRPGGEFAGRFQTTKPPNEFQGGQEFEIVVPFSEFHLDPSLRTMKGRLASTPFALNIESFWCHSLGKQAGLELIELELIPSSREEVPQ